MAPNARDFGRFLPSFAGLLFATMLSGLSPTARAAQIDISPAAGGSFGSTVAVLPNGNFVVADVAGQISNTGAIYLYAANSTASTPPISVLTGSSSGDQVGSGGPLGPGIVVLTSGDFVVVSPSWNNGAATGAGAVTWVSGTSGLSGVVSASNSLVGTKKNDAVGFSGVTPLANGAYVVSSYNWGNGSATDAGAVTFAGSGGIVGAVSASNSLVGSTAGDGVGFPSVTLLSNGNVVVASSAWNNGSASQAGAVTWMSAATGLTGVVSASNSLVGSTASDNVGQHVTALTIGNYVVASPNWSGGGNSSVGAATWASGTTGLTGTVSAANSLLGSTSDDQVGSDVVALSNGNYVVVSGFWHNGSAAAAGAATWGNGANGITGTVSASNSLVGTTANDVVGFFGVTSLTNGNYVVEALEWHNSAAVQVGAATWGSGSTGTSGLVTAVNSLVGSTSGDDVGSNAIVALSNGNYVVCSSNWHNGGSAGAGAATWANGSTGLVGVVSASNSLVGTAANDFVGNGGATALANGNYVVRSPQWNNGATAAVGAATWGNGTTGTTGLVTSLNSLIGTTANDEVSSDVIYALNNGNYLVFSSLWNNGAATSAGAVTFANGSTGKTGVVSKSNSLVGSTANDLVGQYPAFTDLSDGNFLIFSKNWSNAGLAGAGAITLGSDRFRLAGPIQAYNSVRGGVASGGNRLTSAYDAQRHRLIVGRPAENIVSLFTMDQIFADGLE